MIDVREAAVDDLPALRRLFLASRQATFVWQPDSERSLDDFDGATEGELVLVATIDGEIAGFASCWLPENFIHNLFVAPDRLRRGVGTKLLAEALLRIGRPAWLKCDRRNADAIAFYRASGWQEYQERFEEGAEWIPFVVRT